MTTFTAAEFALLSKSLRQFIAQSQEALAVIEHRTDPMWDDVRKELTADIEQAEALLARVNAAKE